MLCNELSRRWLSALFAAPACKRSVRRPQRRSIRPSLETLEGRLTPTAFKVAAGDVAGLITDIKKANSNGQNNTIDLVAGTYDLKAADNYWYGPTGLPAISSNLTINGNGAIIQRDSAASTPAFRLFYVSGGFDGLAAGTLTLNNLELKNGLAQGGSSNQGGGGLGAGGAIFNQGTLILSGDTLTGNTAAGGNTGNVSLSYNGGGMGQDAQTNSGGGFGGATPGVNGGAGGAAGAGANGGGGGGFGILDKGGSGVSGGAGGGTGGFGGAGGGQGGSAGDGGGGGERNQQFPGGFGPPSGAGGDFGQGGQTPAGSPGLGGGGGGGIGGGGGEGVGGGGGGGGFGGGGAGTLSGEAGSGGFGAGGGFGLGLNRASGGFGGGQGGINTDVVRLVPVSGGGGAAMGGAIFNMLGSVTVTNSTFTANLAKGGSAGAGAKDGNGGSGYGAAVFNLDGTVKATFATLDANTVAAGTGAKSGQADGGEIYSLAFGHTINVAQPNPPAAHVTLVDSILADSKNSLGVPVDDLVTDLTTAGDTATTDLSQKNLVMLSTTHGAPTIIGTPSLTTEPLLGPLANNGGPTLTQALSKSSRAIGAGVAVAGLTTDQRGDPRSSPPSLGAVEAQSSTVANPTTVLVNPVSIPFSSTPTSITLSAKVTSVSPVNGTISFVITNRLGSPIQSVSNIPVSGGLTQKNVTMPAAMAQGTYTITASFSDPTGNFASQQGANTLSVTPANTVTTITSLSPSSVSFSGVSSTTITLSAQVVSGSNAVTEGNVTFSIANIASSGEIKVVNGKAGTTLTIPAGTAVGSYTVVAIYNDPHINPTGQPDFLPSSGGAPLSITPAAATPQVLGFTVTNGTITMAFATETVHVSVTGPGGPANGGTVTVTLDGKYTGSAPVVNGSADVAITNLPTFLFAIPLLGETQTITANYSGATNFGGGSTTATAFVPMSGLPVHSVTLSPSGETIQYWDVWSYEATAYAQVIDDYPLVTLNFLPNGLLNQITLADGSYQQLDYGYQPVGLNPVPLYGFILGANTHLAFFPYDFDQHYGLFNEDGIAGDAFGALVLEAFPLITGTLVPSIYPEYEGVAVF